MPLEIPRCECGEADVEITCPQCEQDFCTKCDEKTHWSSRLKQHGRRPYTTGIEGTSQYCPINGHEKQQLSLFCQTCLKLICGPCVVGDHKLHSAVPLKEAIETGRRVLQAALLPLQERITKSERDIIEIQKKE